ncbi:MAG: hypothetical protein Ct9H300mP28_03670 [Pseudomonadota bacterium]|nr:MAG: hypothetical protein Ct9H300mP28_03670 [Pseudomonadota bacterium]
MDKISEVTGQADSGGKASVAFRVIADHLRSLSFAVADGACLQMKVEAMSCVECCGGYEIRKSFKHA